METLRGTQEFQVDMQVTAGVVYNGASNITYKETAQRNINIGYRGHSAY